ncbi:MAG TPA: hypothetical protein VMV23_11065 [Candidatus Nanopelagicaceae bacterium]|nr:hypothetical protein [Candidatus Nanopelagicaceae bacterium]
MVGVILLAVSRRWRLSAKLLGGSGLACGPGRPPHPPAGLGDCRFAQLHIRHRWGATICRSTGFVAPEWLAIAGWAVLIRGPLAVATRLILRLRDVL